MDCEKDSVKRRLLAAARRAEQQVLQFLARAELTLLLIAGLFGAKQEGV
jgi:hypothetical protein